MNYFVAFLVLVSLSISAEVACTYEAKKGINYNLGPMMNKQTDYRVKDILEVTGNKTYVFNICRDVVTIPKDGKGGNNCASTIHDKEGDLDIQESRPVPVFQIDNVDGSCRRMAGPLNESVDQKNYQFYPYDYSRLDAGVVLGYANGDYVYPGWMYSSSHLAFRCSDKVAIPDNIDMMQTGMGGVRMWFDNVYGCPVECHPKSDGTICNKHGICMFDVSVESTRCFCNDGRKGEDCSKGVGLSLTNIVMILDIAAIIAVVFTIVYLGCKLRKIRLDPEADVSLDTKFNELGSIAYTI